MSSPGEALSKITAASGMPSSATFLVTDRCNYECVHCYQEHGTKDELTLEEIDRILGELADAGVLFLTLMGGEYFMRRDADDILRRARELGFAIRLKTTGHHIHDRRADFLATLRPLQVELSMYAARPHLHEQVTQQAGSWKRTYMAARRLVERKIPVQLNAPVTEGTVDGVEELGQLAGEIGAGYSFDPKIKAVENGDVAPVALRMSADSLERFYGEREIGDYVAGSFARAPDLTKELKPLEFTPCRAGQMSVTITPQGKVWPCNALPIECGDLRAQSFIEVWTQSGELDEVRGLSWATLAECNVCELRNFCSRCHGMALIEQGDMRGPSLEACRHAVAVRDSLKERGLLPHDHDALPPTWERVDPDGQHHDSTEEGVRVRRPASLRVVS